MNLTVVELPTGPTPPCTWFVDLPCDDLAVAIIATDRHRAGACDRCLRLALETAAIQAAKAEAWDEGHSWGWSDAQDAHDVRQAMDRADWPLSTPNPYRETDQ